MGGRLHKLTLTLSDEERRLAALLADRQDRSLASLFRSLLKEAGGRAGLLQSARSAEPDAPALRPIEGGRAAK